MMSATDATLSGAINAYSSAATDKLKSNLNAVSNLNNKGDFDSLLSSNLNETDKFSPRSQTITRSAGSRDGEPIVASDARSSNLNSRLDLSSAQIALAPKDTSNLSAADKAKLKEQTDAFEAFMLKEVLDLALGEDEKNSLFPKDAGDKIYKSMYNEAMSESLAGNFGFSEILYNFLLERAK